MTIKEFLKLNNPIREKDYISFFFKNITDIKLDRPIFELLSFAGLNNLFISIVKDTVERLDNSRHLAQRNTRNCIFCFVEKSKWRAPYLPTNNVLDKKTEEKLGDDIIRKLHEKLKERHIAWYVHSYVYIILVFAEENGIITKDDYYIYYWNTNLVFKKFPNKTAIFGNTMYVRFVEHPNNELELIESKDKELIDCVKAFKNGDKEFELFKLTKEHFDDVCFEIDNGIEYTFIEGPARSGKTILAMLLMNRYSDCKLLLLNYVFYKDLKMAFKTLGEDFPNDRIFHHNLSAPDGKWLTDFRSLKFVSDFSFLIVDEAQRMSRLDGFTNKHGIKYLPFNPFNAIKNIKNHKHTIFLGDDLQRINGKHDEGFEVIKKHYLDKTFREHKFYQTIGIPKTMINNILFLLGFEGSSPNNPGEYNINLFNSINEFIEGFNSDFSKRKHYVSLAIDFNENNSFGDTKTIEPLPKEYSGKFNYLFNDEVASDYYLSPYEIISREAESIYLYIPDYVDELNYKEAKNKRDTLIYRQLYTLMTRATASLNIYAENEKTKDVLLSRIKEIKDSEEARLLTKEFEYDVFIAYHGTNLEGGSYYNAKKLCDELTESGLCVYLHGYSCKDNDRDIGFNETTRIIQKSAQMVAVVNDNPPMDEFGMLLRQNKDGGINQFYQELTMFNNLINVGKRGHKKGFKFLYCGRKTDINDIYLFLNQLYRELTYGFNCLCISQDDLVKWVLQCKDDCDSE